MRLRPSIIAAIAALANLWVTCPSDASARTAEQGLARATCEALSAQDFGNRAHVVSAGVVDAMTGLDRQDWAPLDVRDALAKAPGFCRVVLVATPSSGSRIGVEVWLPMTAWNGRFVGTGNGGYPDRIAYGDMIEGVQAGYAAANTDMGLAGVPAAADEKDITERLIGNPVALVDFGSRSTHEMTVLAKALIQVAYGQDPLNSYFVGCSTGGMQGFSEAQRYPADYDGIVVGAPGQNRARVHLSILWDFLSVWRQPQAVLSGDQLERMHQEVLRSCDTAGQGYVEDPLACDWSPQFLLCGQIDGVCLTQEQINAAERIYAGPRNPRTGEVYLDGLPRGSELGWGLYMGAAAAPMPFGGVFKAVLGRDFNFETFDWDRDALTFIAATAPYFDATETDLTAYFERGGKLVVYHGGSDPLAPFADTERHVAALSAMPGQGDAIRYFRLPGMDHCGGGAGPGAFDRLAVIRSWVEQTVVPETIPVHRQGASLESRSVVARRLIPSDHLEPGA